MIARDDDDLMDILNRISETIGERFIMIIDEWYDGYTIGSEISIAMDNATNNSPFFFIRLFCMFFIYLLTCKFGKKSSHCQIFL